MATVPATLLSTFEVLFTPQLPPGLGPPAVAQVDEMVVKGYFLTLSNPNSTAYTFNVGFHCNPNPTPVPVTRTLASAVAFLDDGSTGNPVTIVPGMLPTDFSVSVTVAANGTVLLGILPQFFTSSGLASATIDCRGWVDVTLPAVLRFVRVGTFGFFEFVPQAPGPVSVLVTPEQRLTFLPMAGDAATAVEAQAAGARAGASGGSEVAVPPQQGGPLFKPVAAAASLSEMEQAALRPLFASSPSALYAALSALVASSPAVQGGERSVEDALDTLGFKQHDDRLVAAETHARP